MQLDLGSIEGSGSLNAPAEDRASSRIKAILMERLREMRRSRALTQVETARWFGVSQPRISHLAQNRMNRFTVDTLIDMLAHAGIRLSLTFDTCLDKENPPRRRDLSRKGRE